MCDWKIKFDSNKSVKGFKSLYKCGTVSWIWISNTNLWYENGFYGCEKLMKFSINHNDRFFQANYRLNFMKKPEAYLTTWKKVACSQCHHVKRYYKMSKCEGKCQSMRLAFNHLGKIDKENFQSIIDEKQISVKWLFLIDFTAPVDSIYLPNYDNGFESGFESCPTRSEGHEMKNCARPITYHYNHT